MLELKKLDRQALTDAARLSDDTFREQGQTSMATAFPAMFDTNAGLSVGAYAEGKLVAFVGIVPWTIQAGALPLPVMSIGSVCTDPAWRGQGLAGSLAELAFRHAEQAYASVLKLRQKLLVAEQEGRLTGFLAIGVPTAAAGKATALEWAGDPDAIYTCASSFRCRCHRLAGLPTPDTKTFKPRFPSANDRGLEAGACFPRNCSS